MAVRGQPTGRTYRSLVKPFFRHSGGLIKEDVLMCKRLLLIIGCVFLLLTNACVSRHQYITLEAELKDARLQLEQADKKFQQLEADLIDSEKIKSRCVTDLTNLQARNAYLKNINRQLSGAVKNLNVDLVKKKSVIQLQEKVIRLLDDTKKTIETSLKDQIADQDVEIVEIEDQLKVVFVDKILFDSGSYEISEKGEELLLVIAESIRDDKDQKIVVQGHTDNFPIRSGLRKRFPSNWELSTSRAAAVVRFLQEKGGLRPARLEASGFSFYRPVATNNTEEGRRQNRRIEIILGPSR
jgi:chemotaxis protein MotB